MQKPRNRLQIDRQGGARPLKLTSRLLQKDAPPSMANCQGGGLLVGWLVSCATLQVLTGLARPLHARVRRARSGAAEPPEGGSLHVRVLLVGASPPRSGHCVWWFVGVCLPAGDFKGNMLGRAAPRRRGLASAPMRVCLPAPVS